MTIKQAAHSLTQAGWKVFPLKAGTKVPATPNGFKDALFDAEAFTWASSNVGIATGRESDLVVIDVDPKNGGIDTMKALQAEHGDIKTLYARTPSGGYHLYFTYPAGEAVRSRAGIYKGVDVRADGGYVVAPPSTLPGGEYKWADGEATPQPLPKWLLNRLVERIQPSVKEPVLSPSGLKGSLAKATLAFILDGAADGMWHSEMYKAVMDLKQQGFSEEEATAKLQQGGITLDTSHDLPLISDVYNNREPKHPPRIDIDANVVVPAASLLDTTMAYLNNKDAVEGLPTGFTELDGLLGGGKRLGELTVWHAEAKTGKNTFWHQLMHLWLGKGIPIGYASREMSPALDVLPNLFTLETKVNALKADVSSLRSEFAQLLSKWPLFFAEGYGYFSPEHIFEWMTSLKKLGVKYFWFDHLHYMLLDPEDHKAAASLIRELKAFVKAENVHLDLIVQPNKLLDGQRLGANSLKGGAAIGQALDNLFTMERVQGEKDMMKITLERARSKLASPGEVFFRYDKNTMTFVSQRYEAPVRRLQPPTAYEERYQ